MPVFARIISDVLVIALGARSHMPTKHLGSAGLDCRHHLELAQANMARIGPPPRRTIVAEDVSNLQFRFGQVPEA